MRTHKRSQSGDTLVEVTIALAILSLILIASVVVATRSFLTGETAKERTVISGEAQSAMEKLRAFRDNREWAYFLYGQSPTYRGVLNATGGGCHTVGVTDCFHMIPTLVGPNQEYVPAGGPVVGSIPTSYLEIVAEPGAPGAGGDPASVTVTIYYGFEGRGGGVNTGHIKTLLVNVKK